MMRLALCLGFFLSLAGWPGIASALYKCESGGKVTYSNEACKEGKSTALDNADSAVQGKESEKAAKRLAQDKARLRQIEAERAKREAVEDKENARIAKARAAQDRKCRTLAMKKKWLEEDAARSQGKSAEAAKRKATRQAEQYALECGGIR
jgi:hypothetical protein